MIFVTRKTCFSSAHRLYNSLYDEDWNRKTYGLCSHPRWHGHNYILKVTVTGKSVNPQTGYLIDLGRLGDIIHQYVTQQCDHKNLNLDIPFLKNIIPSAENLATAFFEQLKDPIHNEADPYGYLYAVYLRETDKNESYYCPFIY